MTPKNEGQNAIPERVYSSVTALVEHVKALPGTEITAGQGASSWSGGSLLDAYQLALYGWADGAAKASALSERIATRVVQSQSAMSLQRDVHMDVTGGAFDMGAYLAGEPECWIAFQEQESKRGIRIVGNVASSAGVPESAIMTRGIAMTALALSLQASGYAVTIDVMCAYLDNTIHIVRVHDGTSGSVLDVDAITYAMAHPSMPRNLMFATAAKNKDWNRFNAWNGWARNSALGDLKPSGAVDLYVGNAHLFQAQRWQDGGEAWVLSEFERQTNGGNNV